jgi:hypothetical protein
MQPQTADNEFPDMKSHVQMYSGYTGMMLRSAIGLAILLLLIGWITGVL